MAGQITHMLAGETAAAAALGGSIEPPEAVAAFLFGCQGPDIFYHNQRTKPSGLHYGSLAHRRRSGTMVAAAAAAVPPDERAASNPLGAYALGLSTHAAVDRETHPFIVCFSGWADPSDPSTKRRRGCHPFLERILDACLLRRRTGASPEEYGIAARMGIGTEGAASLDEEAAGIWPPALRAAFPKAASSDIFIEARVRNALADARHFYLTTDPSRPELRAGRDFSELGAEEARYAVSVLYPLGRADAMDPMNDAGAEWPHPSGDGRSSRSSYPELVEAGAVRAAAAIRLVLDFWEGSIDEAALAAELGDGALALSDAEGEAEAPRVCRPLLLPEAMDAEIALRAAGGPAAR